MLHKQLNRERNKELGGGRFWGNLTVFTNIHFNPICIHGLDFNINILVYGELGARAWSYIHKYQNIFGEI